MSHSPKSPSAATGPPFLRRIINLDTGLSLHLHTLTEPFLPRSLFLLLELSADFRFFFPVALAFLLTPSPSSSLFRRPFLSPLILGSLLDLALVGLIKILVRRSRPIYNHNASMSVVVSADSFSFPSGHASRVCFVASIFYLSGSVIGEVVKDLRYQIGFLERVAAEDEGKLVNLVVLTVWIWAICTSLSRVLLGRHFVGDIFAGACLGVLEGLFAFRFFRF